MAVQLAIAKPQSRFSDPLKEIVFVLNGKYGKMRLNREIEPPPNSKVFSLKGANYGRDI